MEIHQIARTQMQDAGHMYTRSRRLVVDTLAELDAPVTIPAILRAAPDLVQSSLYRNLAVLVEAGVVTRLDLGDDRSYFELSELVTHEHHHHLICRSCSTVVDFALPARAEATLTRSLAAAADDAGFSVEDHRVDLVGICASCSTGK